MESVLGEMSKSAGEGSFKHQRLTSDQSQGLHCYMFYQLETYNCVFDHAELQKSYLAWVERMKPPPKIEKSPLDMDWPDLLLAGKKPTHPKDNTIPEASIPNQHPPGPFIDADLAEHQTLQRFEEMVLDHFLVFDASKQHFREK